MYPVDDETATMGCFLFLQRGCPFDDREVEPPVVTWLYNVNEDDWWTIREWCKRHQTRCRFARYNRTKRGFVYSNCVGTSYRYRMLLHLPRVDDPGYPFDDGRFHLP